MMSLAGKVALVTGSTSGLGVARALAAAGVHVMLHGFADKAQIRGIALPLDGGWTAQ
jgi:3-hydroxybutyrate dehydrogenase